MTRIIKKRKGVILFLLITLGIGGWLLYVFKSADDKTVLLPGETTHGHYQIEMACAACHTNEKRTNIFTSAGVSNKACMECHGEALDEFSDSHPTAKFKNPENHVFIEHINAAACIACHQEHNQKVTGEMGVTIPQDFCAKCHQVTLENLESHKNLAFNTCATAGCHNYHDNIALSPSFLLKNYGKDDYNESPKVNPTNPLVTWLDEGNKARKALNKISEADAPVAYLKDEKLSNDWLMSAHAKAGINCSDCHGTGDSFVERPGINSCQECHSAEYDTFLNGKHGMRLAHEGLGPMLPQFARSPMRKDAPHAGMSCNSCHSTHSYDREYAAQQACINCHNDQHTLSYSGSAHAKAWKKELSGHADVGTGVSCATCHMPSIRHKGKYIINHDQTANLTPNEKMLRSVCLDCHGLQFAMDALSDRELIDSNFKGQPSKKHPGIGWTVDTAIKLGDEDVIKISKYLNSISTQDATRNKTNNNKNE